MLRGILTKTSWLLRRGALDKAWPISFHLAAQRRFLAALENVHEARHSNLGLGCGRGHEAPMTPYTRYVRCRFVCRPA
jgi:hypothetical protein